MDHKSSNDKKTSVITTAAGPVLANKIGQVDGTTGVYRNAVSGPSIHDPNHVVAKWLETCDVKVVAELVNEQSCRGQAKTVISYNAMEAKQGFISIPDINLAKLQERIGPMPELATYLNAYNSKIRFPFLLIQRDLSNVIRCTAVSLPSVSLPAVSSSNGSAIEADATLANAVRQDWLTHLRSDHYTFYSSS